MQRKWVTPQVLQTFNTAFKNLISSAMTLIGDEMILVQLKVL